MRPGAAAAGAGSRKPGLDRITLQWVGLDTMRNVIILGSQWGDEGKGKIVDLFSERFDIVARYQGGHNAGHTVFIGERKYILKLIPSGILRPGKQAVIGNGLVIDPAALLAEIDTLEAAGVAVAGQLFISNRAHLLFPEHRMMEKMSEGRAGRISIGTTSRGIGPCYEDKVARRGIRVADLLDRDAFRAQYDSVMEEKVVIAKALGIYEEMDLRAIRDAYEAFGERIRPMVCDTSELLNRAIRDGKTVLFEGAQGTMLDIDHGTYPFVTSSSATAGGACTGTGVAPTRISGVIGVSKAYITRVGGGSVPHRGAGRGGRAHPQTRQRVRLGLPAARGAAAGSTRRCCGTSRPSSGFDSIVVTKLDVLDEFETIPVCVGYRAGGRDLTEMPSTVAGVERVEPVYECVPGWGTSTFGVSSYDELPENARRYIAYLEKLTGVEVGCVSTGPERNQTIVRAGSRFERLVAA